MFTELEDVHKKIENLNKRMDDLETQITSLNNFKDSTKETLDWISCCDDPQILDELEMKVDRLIKEINKKDTESKESENTEKEGIPEETKINQVEMIYVKNIMDKYHKFKDELKELSIIKRTDKMAKFFMEHESTGVDFHFCEDINVDYMVVLGEKQIYYNSMKRECYTQYGLFEYELQKIARMLKFNKYFVGCYYYDPEEACLMLKEIWDESEDEA